MVKQTRSADGDWLTIAEAAEIFKVAPPTIRNWIRDKRIRAVMRRPVGRKNEMAMVSRSEMGRQEVAEVGRRVYGAVK